MASGIWAAASGAVGQIAAMDVSTNNLVNANTPGFKADATIFRRTYSDAVGMNAASSSIRSSVTRTVAPDLTPGMIVSTGRNLDAAIADDKGFFVVSTPSGNRYTRAGNFQLRPDGALTSNEGLPVLSSGGQPVTIDPNTKDVQINRQGVVVVDGEPGPQLSIVRFANPEGLQKSAGVELVAGPSAGPPIAHDGGVEPRALELSNESAVSGMADEVTTSRVFDMTTRIIEAFSKIERSAANDISKPA